MERQLTSFEEMLIYRKKKKVIFRFVFTVAFMLIIHSNLVVPCGYSFCPVLQRARLALTDFPAVEQ